MSASFDFTAELFRWEGDAAWHFVALPPEVSDEIEHRTLGRTGGFGSVKVEATIGSSTWSTSLFPDRTREAYVLPVKRAVRDREGIDDGDRVEVTVEIAS